MNRKTAILIGTLAAAGVAVGTVAAVNDSGDPTESVGVVDLARSPSSTTQPSASNTTEVSTTTAGTTRSTTPTTGANDASTTTNAPQNRQVLALEQLSGTFQEDVDRDGDTDHDDFEIGRVDLDFGPDDWLRTAGPIEDFDGDGTAENVLDELRGLVGQEVTLLVRFDDDDEADVYVINDLTFRDSSSGSAPWETDTERAEARQQAIDAAMAAVPNAARVDDVDRNGDGSWDVEIVDNAEREHDVRVSAAGAVLRVDPDDHIDHDDND